MGNSIPTFSQRYENIVMSKEKPKKPVIAESIDQPLRKPIEVKKGGSVQLDKDGKVIAKKQEVKTNDKAN